MTSIKQQNHPNLYLAGPLFCDSERSYNTYLKHLLAEHADVYLPQEDGLLICDLIQSGMSVEQASSVIFKNDVNAVRQCDILLILLDGRAVDEGAAFELGLAYQTGKLCIGLQTDFRRLAPFGNNPMLTGAIQEIFTKPEEVLAWLKQYVSRRSLSTL